MESIYDFVTAQMDNFRMPVDLADGWRWSFYEHVRLSYLYKNSQFGSDNDDRDNRPYKNIVRSIVNIQYRTEGFDVKDIELFVDDSEEYYKSFLVDKFHNQWALEHGLDTFIDELVESYVDYGGALVKNIEGVKPEVVNMLSLAFCDQTDILGGPFGIRHFFNPDQLKKMEAKGWGKESNGANIDIDTLITLSEYNRKQAQYGSGSKTPGKYIELIEVHGVFPQSMLKGESEEYAPQMHIIGFYKNKNGEDVGVTLFAVKEPKPLFKFLKRDPVYGRALGFGGVEELFEAQVWTNYSVIQQREMLENAAKTLYKTTDPTFKNRNKITNLEQGEIMQLQQGTDIAQLDTTPRNIVIFQNAVREWESHAQQIGGAGEALMGQSPSAGTPFKLQELVTLEAKGLHHYRQGKIAVFIDEIYRDWVLPYIVKEVIKGQTFLSELNVDELQSISSNLAVIESNEFIKEKILNGELVSSEEIENIKIQVKEAFLRSGSKKFIEILKGELKDVPLKVKTNIANKQRNLALLTDKVVNLIRQIISTPQILNDPYMRKLLNIILESSGMSPLIFGAEQIVTQTQPTRLGSTTQPLKEFSVKQLELTNTG